MGSRFEKGTKYHTSATPETNLIQALLNHRFLIAVRLYGAGAAFYNQTWTPGRPGQDLTERIFFKSLVSSKWRKHASG